MTAKSIFISYSSHDRQAAEKICAALEARGFDCWIAGRDASNQRDRRYALVTAHARAAGDRAHALQRRVITTSKYSPGITTVPSLAMLNSPISALISAASASRAGGLIAAKAFKTGP